MKGSILAVGLTAAGLAGAAPAAAQSLIVAHGFSPTHVISAQGVEPWMECMKAKSPGVAMTYFPSGQIASTKEMLDALNNAVAQATTVPIGYVASKMPLNGVSMLPGLGSSASEVIPVYSKAVKEGRLAEEFAANRIHPIWVMVLPAYQMVSRKGAITTLDQFDGLVVRSAGGSMNLTISSLGASAAEIPSSDMYVAMERGTVDATLAAMASIKPYNIQELMKAVSTNGEFGSFSIAFSMSDDAWKGLSGDQQAAAMECGAQVETSIAKFLDDEVISLQAEFAKAGIEVYQFPPETVEAMREKLGAVADDWVKRLADRGLPAQEVLDAYRATLAGK